MICPGCGVNRSAVTDSRQTLQARKRTYLCHACGLTYYTTETVCRVGRIGRPERRTDENTRGD